VKTLLVAVALTEFSVHYEQADPDLSSVWPPIGFVDDVVFAEAVGALRNRKAGKYKRFISLVVGWCMPMPSADEELIIKPRGHHSSSESARS